MSRNATLSASPDARRGECPVQGGIAHRKEDPTGHSNGGLLYLPKQKSPHVKMRAFFLALKLTILRTSLIHEPQMLAR